MYTDYAELESVDDAEELAVAANKYLLDSLFKVCVAYLKTEVRPDTVWRILATAELLDNRPELSEACVNVSHKTNQFDMFFSAHWNLLQ